VRKPLSLLPNEHAGCPLRLRHGYVYQSPRGGVGHRTTRRAR